MVTKVSFQRPSGHVSADPDADHSSALHITVIRRDQMPEDLRSEFLPRDLIIVKEPRGTDSAVSQTLAEARRRLTAVDLECPWCRLDNVCTRLILAWAGMVLLGASVVLDWKSLAVLALYAFSYVITGWGSYITTLKFVPASLRSVVERYRFIRSGGCSRDVKQHRLASLARCILSPGSLILLQQPILNLWSFVLYRQSFPGLGENSSGTAFEQEVDEYIRHCTAQGVLHTEVLAGSSTQALLGLEQYREEFTWFGCSLLRQNLLYQNYRDWRRWRLASIICERIQAGDTTCLPLGMMDGQNLLDGEVEGRDGHKWFMVDPRLFSSSLRQRLAA